MLVGVFLNMMLYGVRYTFARHLCILREIQVLVGQVN
jgi:hypothetical protein